MRRIAVLLLLLNMNYIFSNDSLPESVREKVQQAQNEADKIFFSQNNYIDNACLKNASPYGRDQVDYFEYVEKFALIETIKTKDARWIQLYLQNMSYDNYEKFIQLLSEEEWQIVLGKISLRGFGDFPVTLEGQIEMLQEIYLAAVKTVVCPSDINLLILSGIFFTGFDPLFATGGLIVSEICDWDGRCRVAERLKTLDTERVSFEQKKAFIRRTIMDYYSGSVKIGLEGAVKLDDEIKKTVDSLFNEKKTKMFC